MKIKELIAKVKMGNVKKVEKFPSRTMWGEIYEKYREMIIAGLSSWYGRADREDAVENAFDKLMNKKDPAAYGDKMPASMEAWAIAVYWQARSFLSHMKEHSQIEAKYIEKMSKELEDAFISENQGAFLDAATISRALPLALKLFKKGQDISRRDLNVYLGVAVRKIPGKALAKKHNITAINVYTIKCRIGELLGKYGRKYFQAALKKVA